MSRRGRILILDDLAAWRNEQTEILQRGGFYTSAAATSGEALEMLTGELFHLAVLDIRLQQGVDETEGMALLERLDESGLLGAVEVIMHSAYGTLSQMRRAFARYDVANFLDKGDFDDIEFLSLIQQTFEHRVQANFDLEIHWDDISGPEQAVLRLELDGIRIKDGSDLQAQMAVELEDLLCRLFFEAKSLIVTPLARGHGGSAVLHVAPFFENGAGQPVIVDFGDFRAIETEHSNFRNYVQNYVGGYRSSTVLGLRRTPHLGGITYSFLGDRNDRIESFATFYARATPTQIIEALDNLFTETCGEWYANPGQLQPRDLTEEYQQLFKLTPEILSKALNERLKMVQFKHRLKFPSLDGERTFTNPISVLANRSLTRATYVCITHGDLNGDNILIDNVGHTWLIDFQSTGPGHILRDISQLESWIRFQLLTAEEASLADRLKMEEALCECKSLQQAAEPSRDFQTDNAAVAKAYAATVHLRAIAHKLLANNPQADIGEYNIALLYCALNTIRYYSLPTVQRQHALLSGSLLADHPSLG